MIDLISRQAAVDERRIVENGGRSMTNEEAIKILEVAKAECEWNAPLDYQEAFKVAISALEKQTPKKPTETIDRALGIPSRQAVCPEPKCYIISKVREDCENCHYYLPFIDCKNYSNICNVFGTKKPKKGKRERAKKMIEIVFKKRI